MTRLRLYQRLALVSGLVLALLGHFAFGWLSFFVPSAKASAITWISTTSGNWDDPSNWSSGTVPTSEDDVIIAPTNGGIIVTVPTTTIIYFSTLTFDTTNIITTSTLTTTEIRLQGDIGSGGDITIRGTASSSFNLDPRVLADVASSNIGNFAILRQMTPNKQTISGDLTVEYGGTIANRALTQLPYIETSVYFEAQNIEIEPGGSIVSSAHGVANAQSNGTGAGPGIYGTGPNASGGAHAGNGGVDLEGDLGGVGYCDFENPTTAGSSGAGSLSGFSGSGAGNLQLIALEELTINGKVRASGGSNPGGGGSGGSIILSADVISGTPQYLLAKGGNNVIASGPNGGGGGGGCVKIEYGTSTSIDEHVVEFYGGKGYYQNGGAGTLFLHKQDDSIRKLYAFSTTTASSTLKIAAETPQSEDEHSFQTLSINTSSIYTIGDGKTLVLTDDHPFDGSSTSGTIKIEDGGTLKIDSNAVIEHVTIELHEGGLIVDSATDLSTTLDFTIGAGGIFDMRDYTTSSDPFELGSLTIDDGGVVTHGSHEGLGNTPTHMVNISAVDITIRNGGVIDVSGKGFSGGQIAEENGFGPGGGQHVENEYQSGGGHGAEGGVVGSGGGAAYCDISNPSTLGSGGAAASAVSSTTRGGFGGDGGGLIWLTASDSVVIDGKILTAGFDGGWYNDEDIWPLGGGGGGAGGGIKIAAATVTGTPETIYIGGGIAGFEGVIDHFTVGGGGCMLVTYTETSTITSSTVELSPFGSDPGYSEEGIFNSAPLIRGVLLKGSQPVFTGHVVVSSTEPTSPFGLQVRGNYAYIGSALTSISTGNTKGLYIADISNPASPVIISNIVSSTIGGSSFALSGNYVYTVNAFFHGTSSGVGSMQIIDVSDPYNPVLRGSIVSSTELYRVSNMVVSGGYAYIAGNQGVASSSSGLKVVDISDPDAPVLVGNLNDAVNLNNMNDVVVKGDYAYGAVGTNNSLVVIDISDPTNPVLVASLRDDTKLLGIGIVRVVGNHAYVAGVGSDLFYIIDISDPLNPVVEGGLVGTMDGPGRLTISGDYAYIPGFGSNSVYVVDISDPDAPTLMHAITSTDSMSLKGIRNSAVADGYLYTVNGGVDENNFLSIFDIQNPSLSFQAEDLDKTTLSVKAEYVAGTCAYSGTSYASFSTSTVTSTYGLATIDNSAGDNRRIQNISTLNNSNNVTSTWLTTTDIPDEEGEYCVFLTPYDGSVNGSQTTSTIVLDLASVSPATPILSYERTQTSITLSWAAVNGADHYVVSSTVSEISTETDETSVTFAGLPMGSPYIFQIKAVDTYGNESTYSTVLSVTTLESASSPPPTPPSPPPDTTPSSTPTSTPSNPSGLIVINHGDFYTKSREVSVAFDTSFTSAYVLSDTEDFSGKIYAPIVSSTSYILTPGDGEKRIYARFSNTYGVYDAYDVIVLDTLAPTAPTITSFVSPDLILKSNGVYGRKNTSSTVRIKPTLGGTAEPGTRIVITASYGGTNIVMMALAAVETYYTTADGSGNWSFTFPTNLNNTVYTIQVQTEDGAENRSSPVTTELDLSTTQTPPPEEEPPIEEPPIEEPPEEVPPEELPIEEPPIEEPPCTTDCGGEEVPPVGTGEDDTGTGTDGETTTDASTGSDSTESTSESIVSNITESVSVISDTIATFFGEVGDSLQEIPLVRGMVETASVALEKTREVINNPTVEKTNEVLAAPILAAAAVANVAVGGAGLLSQVMLYLRLIFSQPVLLLRLRKQKSWGVVFNTYTKQPVDLATVRLLSGGSNTVMRTQVTDSRGRYFMIADAGTYALEAQKEGFARHDNAREDSVYPNVYHGENLEISDESREINYNISLKPIVEEKTNTQILREYTKKATHKTVSLIGVLATIVSLIISPNPWITALLVFHIVLYGFMKRLAHKKAKGSSGLITDKSTGRQIDKVVIRVFDAAYNKLVETAVTDSKGRYVVLVGPSTYYITGDKEGYEVYKSGIMDFSSEKTGGVGGIITEKFTLTKKQNQFPSGQEEKIHVKTMPQI